MVIQNEAEIQRKSRSNQIQILRANSCLYSASDINLVKGNITGSNLYLKFEAGGDVN